MTTKFLTPGMFVHYWEAGAGGNQAALCPRPALVLVTSKEQPDLGSTVALKIFRVHGDSTVPRAEYTEQPKLGCWSWIPG